ncbi:MAG: VWA domain-containing protein [Candidatus Riflebacteria bacterium]|nr:VWA domain-containing protein [Candidatus Riflebacteria bacterium]
MSEPTRKFVFFNHKRNLGIIFSAAILFYLYRTLLLKFGGFGTRIDDWNFANSNSIESWFFYQYLLLSGVIYLVLMTGCKAAKAFFTSGWRFLQFAVLLMVVGVLWAISIPNYRHSRIMAPTSSMGLAAGGAKNVDAFRLNIQQNKLPDPSTITFEGLFYDYYFDTGLGENNPDWLFTPSYSAAKAVNPISGEIENFMSVGLNSNLDESKFARKRLNLVIVLDISGSMGSGFYEYYYDSSAEKPAPDEDASYDKMRVANRSIVKLLDHLQEDDRLGIVLFDDEAYLAKPLRELGQTDMAALKNHILAIRPQGGTNMEEGLKMGAGLFESVGDYDPEKFENRIIFLTDAMPNRGATGKSALLDIAMGMTEKSIYTTFLGIGIDFNTELVEAITKVKGANYYAINSAWEFKKRMDKEFEYMVTPLVFDLELQLKSSGYKIDQVMGSPEANEATGELMKVRTLFPSPSQDGQTKGGIILLKMSELTADPNMVLEVRYVDRAGKKYVHEQKIVFAPPVADYYANNGIRKAVVLSNYTRLLQKWASENNASDEKEATQNRHSWERSSKPLTVSVDEAEAFIKMKNYLTNEIKELEDLSMNKEIAILDKILGNAPK